MVSRHGELRLASVVAALVMACAVAAPADAAVLTGVADQRAGFFDARTYRVLELNTVRLTVPWDAGGRPGPWDAWIAKAQRDGARIMLALGHADDSACPGAPCTRPSQDEYGRALEALLATYPAIREITAWNEPNDRGQPTWDDPAAAAGYYETARARCPACLIVAGDFLDDASLPRYLAAYKAALSSSPEAWGLHNYLDAAYFRTSGVETMLRETSGPLWLTETGGIVRLTFSWGDLLSHDEQRAADSLTWLYGLASSRPRIARMYLYQWRAAAGAHWDSGLLAVDGRPRPSYRVVSAYVPSRGSSRGPALRSTATLRFGRKLRLLAGGRLEVRARCIVRGHRLKRCRQRLLIRVAGKLVTRLVVDVAARALFRRIVRLEAAARSALAHGRKRRVAVKTCARVRNVCTDRGTVAVTKPLRSAGPRRPS